MDQEKIASLIKNIRKENNLTQERLGEILGVTAQAVSKWENGKNIPDIAVLKDISDKYNIDINDILDGENVKKNNKTKLTIVIIMTSLVIILVIISILVNNNAFKSAKISSSCKEFNLQGILSYDKTKSSISISNIEYCGNEDEKVYEEISSILYEKVGDKDIVIDSGKKEQNITLKDYLNKLSFNITNYAQKCKNYKSNNISLEIIGINNKVEEKYVVPLSLEEDC